MKERAPDGTFVGRPPVCHPDRQRKGGDLCTTCYSRERARRNQPANRARSRAWYAANTEYAKSQARRWVRENRGRHREAVLRYRYGLTPEMEGQMMEAQDYRCAICMEPFDGRNKATVAAVDHDHATGKVRGFLHFKCNAGLGGLGDSIENLERAIAYLRAAS